MIVPEQQYSKPAVSATATWPSCPNILLIHDFIETPPQTHTHTHKHASTAMHSNNAQFRQFRADPEQALMHSAQQ